MWPIIIVLLVIAMVIGPVMLMRPSKRDRYLAQLRVKARELKLSVSASPIEDANGSACWFYWLALELSEDEQKALPEPLLLERKPYAHALHVAEYFEQTKGKQVPAGFEGILKQLPESVQAVELNRHALGVHWSERGGEKTLATIADLLTQLLALLRR